MLIEVSRPATAKHVLLERGGRSWVLSGWDRRRHAPPSTGEAAEGVVVPLGD